MHNNLYSLRFIAVFLCFTIHYINVGRYYSIFYTPYILDVSPSSEKKEEGLTSEMTVQSHTLLHRV